MRKLFPSRFPLIISCSLRYLSSGTVSSDSGSLCKLFIYWYLLTCSNWCVCWNFFFFLLCWIAIFGGFTHLHSLWRQSASLKLGIILPIPSFVVKSYTGMLGRGIVPKCPTETEETEDNDAAQHSQHTACFPTTVIPCGNTKVCKDMLWHLGWLKKKYSPHLSFPFYETE